MGNSSGKEQGAGRNGQRRTGTDQPATNSSLTASSSTLPPPAHPIYSSRTGRGSRTDLSSLLGITSGNNAERDMTGLEARRETKQEREMRRAEKEKVAREKERERSMRQEHVDGGYLVTQGVYTGTEDYNKGVVRQLMIERRVAPFWRGLNDHDNAWTENQLVAIARGRPLPPPDAIPDDEPNEMPTANPEAKFHVQAQVQTNVDILTVPITSRAQSFTSDHSLNASPLSDNFPATGTSAPPASSSLGSALSRGRAKTIASLTGTSKTSQVEMTPKEINLPKDPYVNGQPIEATLYKDAAECPICFLYYPPYLNKTRCCDQAICSECFVQIKRPDPHPPGHADPSALVPPGNTGNGDGPHDELVSEPADCPYCQAPEFGVTFEPPPFRRGLAYANQMHPLNSATSAMSSSTSVASGKSSLATGIPRRRTTSISANDPIVITTDRVRPDWHQKLAAARAHTARRSAAATALHTAAYLMGNRVYDDSRSFGGFGRRGLLRRTSGADSPEGASSSQLSMLALMSERVAAQSNARGDIDGEPPPQLAPHGSSRRARADDLEEMMMMEAIRLSLASEEERRKREEKESKKEAKKKDKENKKAEKAAKKTSSLTSTPNQSSLGLGNGLGDPLFDDASFGLGKGKAAQQGTLDSPSSDGSLSIAAPQTHLERARQQILPTESPVPPSPYTSTPRKPSHLRTLSNASSSASSIDSIPGSSKQDTRETISTEVSLQGSGISIPGAVPKQSNYLSGTPPGGGAGTEPMFNFSSLAAMVGDDEKDGAAHEDYTNNLQVSGHQRGENSTGMHFGDFNDFQEDVSALQGENGPSSSLPAPPDQAGPIAEAR